MAYKRTKEIKEKQSIVMKEKIKNYDWDSIIKKRKDTISKTGVVMGRPVGVTGKKTGWYKKCKSCELEFWVIPSNNHRRTYCSKSCMFNDSDYILKLRNADKSYMQNDNYRNKLRDPNLPSYKRYANQVRMLTESNYAKYIDLINPERFARTLCGVDGGYQLDHIMSIKKCYNEGLSIEEAASVNNLQLIPWEHNLAKRTYEKVKN